jgi:ABC-type polysaccharide/polyol phosphate transport system ATPase subunit
MLRAGSLFIQSYEAEFYQGVVIVANVRIFVKGLSIRFRMSYDKPCSVRDKVREMGRRLFLGYRVAFFEALTDIDLTVCDGDIVGIIGPNGSGKSTLLRAIGGIYYPDGGTVDCRGSISTLLSLGTGFDENLSGLDNIRLNGLVLGMTRQEIECKIGMIVDFADVGDQIFAPMKYYSSGMISRISFAIILAMNPDILLVDEVFSVGDLAFQKKSERAMHELLSRASCQLIVTHNLSFVEEHCNRAVYISAGRIVADGSPSDVVECYRGSVV